MISKVLVLLSIYRELALLCGVLGVLATAALFALVPRSRELILYGIFGVLTTVVNFAVYVFCMSFLTGGYANVTSTGIAWAVAVLFAYFTNRVWVFRSKADGFTAKLKECAAFFAARVFSGLIDLAIMYVAVDLMRYDGETVKLLSNVLVIIINYILSKLFVFKKR